MIIYKKAKKKDLPMLIEYKLQTITPYLKTSEEKLKVIAYVSEFVRNNFDKFMIIHYYFKKIGCFLIIDNELDTLYIIDKYRNRKIGSKILKKEKIDKIKVKKKNEKAIKFYEKNGFSKKEEKEDYIILERIDKYENE
mgnify:CR=1 FL=1